MLTSSAHRGSVSASNLVVLLGCVTISSSVRGQEASLPSREPMRRILSSSRVNTGRGMRGTMKVANQAVKSMTTMYSTSNPSVWWSSASVSRGSSSSSNGMMRRRMGGSTTSSSRVASSTSLTTIPDSSGSSSDSGSSHNTVSASTTTGSSGTRITRLLDSCTKSLKSLWKFSRPHTIIGTFVSVVALHLTMLPPDIIMSSASASLSIMAFAPEFLKVSGYALSAALLINLYIVGLNQITDIKIDRVNKPDLPLASGEMNKSQALGVVFFALLSGLGLGFSNALGLTSVPLQLTLLMSALLGTLYSVPPFRLKRFPTSAALCISAVRGFVINFGFAAHAALLFKTTESLVSLPLRCWLVASFYTVYGIVIALAKDVPDVTGDAKFGIRSFSVRMGQKFIMTLASNMLAGLHFAVAGLLAILSFDSNPIPRLIAAACASYAGISVIKERAKIDPSDSEQAYKYYMHLWKLFYLSYFALPLAQ
mmetsp:Transcript_23219/g.45274  ORF Transcript_23219/g.45274 Transcript_23219/m.45274 type:complete len:481 (+) Transcript_23219:140-1582(+)